MQNRTQVRDLFKGGSAKLTSLKARLEERSRVLDQVREALPAELSAAVTTAGVAGGALTLGAVNAAWATRLRYVAEPLRMRIGFALGVEISRIRIRVQP